MRNQRNRPLTPEERKGIFRLTREGKKLKEIVCALGISLSSVIKYRKLLKVSKWRRMTPELEKQIIALYHTGIGQ